MTAEAIDVVASVEGDIESLMTQHLERREHWYAHEYVPWEQGRSFRDNPWDESQATLSPEVRTALEVNLLTEDNLPYYHAKFETVFNTESAIAKWGKIWTAEEGQHAIAIRNYLLVSRNVDPRQLEDHRVATVSKGWDTNLTDPLAIFCYTAAQELATRISHRNAGVKADCEIAHELMSRVAADENHHFLFYRGVVEAMLAEAPNIVLPKLADVLESFEMPGGGIPGFQRKALSMARLGIYNLRIHAEQVIQPLLRFLKVAELTDLNAEGAQAQERLLAMPGELVERAEQFEARIARRKSRV